jgi:hypothetical protein
LDHWPKYVAAGGALIATACGVVQSHFGLLVGIGLLFFGVGEWINHPQNAEIKGTMIGRVYKTIGYRWKPNLFGLLLDALGIGLLGFAFLPMAIASHGI